MTPTRYAAVALSSATLLLFLTGCASKNYVRSQTAPLAQKTNELDDATAANNRSVHELDTRTTTGINQAKGNASTADQHATAAGQSATQAQQSAQDAYNRADSLAGVVANLDSYKPVSDVTVTFRTGKADLSKADKEKLASLGEQVNATKSYILQVTGGTDSTGGADLNYQLSQRRAETVVQYLASQYNIPPRKFYLIGIGKDKEVASNKTAAGRAQNRRVEVQLLTNMDQQAQPQQGQQSQPTAQPPAQHSPAVSENNPHQ